MKKAFFTVPLLMATMCSYASENVKCIAKIHSVDLYPNCAKLYMRGSVNLQKGINTIEVIGIPNQADGGTLKVKVAGDGIDIHSSQIDYSKFDFDQDPQLKKYEKEIDDLLTNSELNNLKIKTIDEQILVLKEQCSVGGQDAKPSVEYVASLIDVLGEKMNKLLATRLELSSKIKSNKVAVDKIDKQREELYDKLSKIDKSIFIIVNSDAEKTASIATEFLVVGCAGWKPYYEVQINGEKCEVVTKAKVNQALGFDLTDVKLNLLSSDIEANSAALPFVHTMYIQPAYDYGVRKSMGSQKMYSNIVKNEMPYEEIELTLDESIPVYSRAENFRESSTMAISNQNYNMENFKLVTSYSIPNDGSIDVKLVSHSVPLVMEYLIMPTVSKNVYLVANLTTADLYNHADANIYLDGTFIGAQSLSPTQMTEDSTNFVIKLSMGVDKNILFNTVSEEKVKGNTTSYKRETKIVSSKNQAVGVKVIEQYPISSNSSVKVEDVVISNGSTPGNGEGIINWVFTLDPNEKVSHSISYRVKESR